MTDNIDSSKARSLVHTGQVETIENMHSLQKVSEEIQQTMDVVDYFRNKVNSLQPPIVNGEPWYKFSFGKASVKEVNNVMESFSTFVQESFKIVAMTQKLQNENDMNICRLVGLLAIVEANSYEKLENLASEMKDLSTEDEDSARQLKELEESFLQSLDDSAIDSKKKEEQMSRIIDYVTLFAQSKTKKIRSISLSLSEIRIKLDKYCTDQDNWIDNANKIIASWQKEVNNNLVETKRQLQDTLERITNERLCQLDDRFAKMKINLEELIAKQNEKIDIELEKQNTKIGNSSKILEVKIKEYKSIIDEQTKTIATQSESIKNQNEVVFLLRKKVNLALTIVTFAIFSMIGILLYIFIR